MEKQALAGSGKAAQKLAEHAALIDLDMDSAERWWSVEAQFSVVVGAYDYGVFCENAHMRTRWTKAESPRAWLMQAHSKGDPQAQEALSEMDAEDRDEDSAGRKQGQGVEMFARSYVVAGRGMPYGVLDQRGRILTAKMLAKMIVSDPACTPRKLVVLHASNSAVAPESGLAPFAHQLSDELGSPVDAPVGYAWIHTRKYAAPAATGSATQPPEGVDQANAQLMPGFALSCANASAWRAGSAAAGASALSNCR